MGKITMTTDEYNTLISKVADLQRKLEDKESFRIQERS